MYNLKAIGSRYMLGRNSNLEPLANPRIEVYIHLAHGDRTVACDSHQFLIEQRPDGYRIDLTVVELTDEAVDYSHPFRLHEVEPEILKCRRDYDELLIRLSTHRVEYYFNAGIVVQGEPHHYPCFVTGSWAVVKSRLPNTRTDREAAVQYSLSFIYPEDLTDLQEAMVELGVRVR